VTCTESEGKTATAPARSMERPRTRGGLGVRPKSSGWLVVVAVVVVVAVAVAESRELEARRVGDSCSCSCSFSTEIVRGRGDLIPDLGEAEADEDVTADIPLRLAALLRLPRRFLLFLSLWEGVSPGDCSSGGISCSVASWSFCVSPPAPTCW